MKRQKEQLRRLLQLIVPMVLLAGIIIGGSRVSIVSIKADTQNVHVKATVTQVLEDYADGEAFAGTQKVIAKITGGEFKDRECELSNANTYQRGALCAPGTKIIALVRENEDGSLTGSVYNYDRTGMVWLLVAVFALALIAVGGKKGAAALYALIFTFVCIVCMYIPMLYAGVNGILTAVLTAVMILAASIYILNGWSVKSGCAIIGTTIGVIISGVLAMAVGMASDLSGYNMSDVESMVYIANSTELDVGNILYAGILISCLGAVMDVSVSVVAAMWEIHEKAPSLTPKELFASGMRVGHDMIGTMSNTLILAYTGSATGVLLTVYSNEMSYLQIMGNNALIIEILSSLCGTIAVIVTVPVQAVITTMVLKSAKQKKH